MQRLGGYGQAANLPAHDVDLPGQGGVGQGAGDEAGTRALGLSAPRIAVVGGDDVSGPAQREVLRAQLGTALDGLWVDLIGVLSVMGDDAGALMGSVPGDSSAAGGEARDVRLRVAATHPDRAQAERLSREVTALYTCGPAGGGGVRTALMPRLNTLSCLVPREAVPTHFTLLEPLNDPLKETTP